MVIDPQRLRVLRAVVASGSIQGAAGNLGYTPSAVSQQISALQRETGLTLLTKVGRGVEPTMAARQLADAAESVLTSLDDVAARVRELRDPHKRTLTIAYFSSAGIAWMPRVLGDLSRDFPDVTIRLTLNDTPPESLTTRTDMHLLVGYPDPAEQLESLRLHGMRHELLLVEPYVVVAPREHRFADMAEVDTASLRGERLIDSDTLNGLCSANVHRACVSAGFVPRYVVETPNYDTALAFVGAGLGLAVLPRLCVVGLQPDLRAIPLVNPTPRRSISVLTRDSSADSPPVRRALATLRECAAEFTAARLD